MAIRLNKTAYGYAQELISKDRVIFDDRDAWTEHQPTAEQENEFIRVHGFREFARWHLGIDDEKDEETKGRYKFPYGDFENIHRCAVLSAERRAGQCEYRDIQSAAAHLHGMLEVVRR